MIVPSYMPIVVVAHFVLIVVHNAVTVNVMMYEISRSVFATSISPCCAAELSAKTVDCTTSLKKKQFVPARKIYGV